MSTLQWTRGLFQTGLALIVWVGVILANGPFCHGGDFEVQNPYRRELTLPVFKDLSLVAIPLDGAIVRAAALGLDDLRVVNSNGVAVPIIRRLIKSPQASTTRPVSPAETSRVVWPVKNLEREILPDGRFKYRFAFQPYEVGGAGYASSPMDKSPRAPEGIRVGINLQDYENRIEILGIDSTGRETPLSSGFLVDYRSKGVYRNDTFAFATKGFDRFALILAPVKADADLPLNELMQVLGLGPRDKVWLKTDPVPIDRVDFFCDVPIATTVTPFAETLDIDSWQRVDDKKTKSTLFTFETSGEPVTWVEIRTRTKNFQRVALVEGEDLQGSGSGWVIQARGTIKRLEYPGIHDELLRLDFPEVRRERMRLVIENGENPPLDIEGIRLGIIRQELIFMAEEGEKYALEYGDQEAQPVKWDVLAIQQILDRNVIPLLAKFGQEKTVRAKRAPRLSWNFLGQPWFLTGVMVLLALLLASSLFRAAKRIDLSQRDGNS